MFFWIGRFLLVFLILTFFSSVAYSVDKIPLVEFHYGDKAYPMVYRPQVPARFIGENFLRGISRFAIPIGVGYLLYDFYNQYQKWTEYLNKEIKTIDGYVKIKNYYCSNDRNKPFLFKFSFTSEYYETVERGSSATIVYIVCYPEAKPPQCTGGLSFDHNQTGRGRNKYVYTYGCLGQVTNLYILTGSPLVRYKIYTNGTYVPVPFVPLPDNPDQSAVEYTSNVSLARPLEDIVSDVNRDEPFSNTSPQVVSDIDRTTTTIIPDEYIQKEIEPIKNENMTSNSSRTWNETSNTTSDLGNTTTTTTGSEDLTFEYEKPGPGFIQDLLNFFKNIRLPIPSISGSGQCSFIIPVPFGKQGVLDFCQYHGLFQIIGNLLVALSGFTGIYILYKNS